MFIISGYVSKTVSDLFIIADIFRNCCLWYCYRSKEIELAMELNIIMNWLLPVTRGKDLPVGTSLQLKWATQA